MEKSIFRKTALDRISSPEQLNEYMKVAGPGVWCILGGLAAVFAAFFIWGVMGSIPQTSEIYGTALALDDVPMAVYCYLPIEETKAISEGMATRVSPRYAPREQYGYIYGTIRSVGSNPITRDTLQEEFGADFQYLSLPPGNLIEVIVELETMGSGTYRWSTSKGASVNLTAGSICELTVITAERKPYELMFR